MFSNEKIIIETEDGLLLEITDSGGEAIRGNNHMRNVAGANDHAFAQKVERKFSEALSSLKSVAKGVQEALDSVSPDEVEVSVGLKLTVKEGKLISLLAEVGTEGTLTVKMKWTKKN